MHVGIAPVVNPTTGYCANASNGQEKSPAVNNTWLIGLGVNKRQKNSQHSAINRITLMRSAEIRRLPMVIAGLHLMTMPRLIQIFGEPLQFRDAFFYGFIFVVVVVRMQEVDLDCQKASVTTASQTLRQPLVIDQPIADRRGREEIPFVNWHAFLRLEVFDLPCVSVFRQFFHALDRVVEQTHE